ncbi:MAG TPA: secretin N-terminal domain-containing protein [Blastocatellia bacterium]|nr:secretin N-terminal domain-containing protein [Blastocatellia bacterium]
MSYRARNASRRLMVVALTLMMASPIWGFGPNGKKHFRDGMQYEQNKQWDKAAQEFAAAAAEVPSNSEYALHLQRALVNASVMLTGRGDMLAEQRDYNAAYQSYRAAFSYDSSNELAQIKMRKMLEVQGLSTDTLPGGGSGNSSANPRRMETGYSEGDSAAASAAVNTDGDQPDLLERKVADTYVARRYPPTDIAFRPTSLMGAIEQLAQSMHLNVVFDSTTSQILARSVNFSVELHDMTPARALEIILDTNNLMYAPEDSRTIVIASDNAQSRMRYEKESVKVFYVKNADIAEVRTALTSTIGTKDVVPYKLLNALVVRDTPSNLALAGALINSLDKNKAEVLVDINLYEVSNNDLLQLGNQFQQGTPTNKNPNPFGLGFLGGVGAQDSILSSAIRTLRGPFGIGVGLPPSAISFFQDKGKAKLLASTQIHALDGEANQIHIGQRVPIETAQVPVFGGTPTTGTGTTGTGVGTGAFSGLGVSGIPQIQYEQVGLNIDMTPTVVSNEVQMKMKIESSSIDGSTSTLTPTFNQRTVSSVARIKDGQTTMIAGISQTNLSKDVKGIPLIGLVPILGRFFSTPNTTNTQSDVVMTVTPHILRNADITREDRLTRDVGPEQPTPKRQLTIEEILYLADHEVPDTGPGPRSPLAANDRDGPDGLASTKPIKSQTAVSPVGVRLPPGASGDQNGVVVVQPMPISGQGVGGGAKPATVVNQQKSTPAAASGASKAADDDDDDDDDTSKNTNPVQVMIRASPVATRGQQFIAAVIINGDAQIAGANLALTYDPNIFEVRGVRDGGMLRSGGVDSAMQFSTDGGILGVQLNRPPGTGGVPARGQLLYVIFEARGKGQTTIGISDQTAFTTPDGQNIPLRLQAAVVTVR